MSTDAIHELELLKKKYFLIAEVMKCALWEYDIKSGDIHLIRKLDGKYSDENLDIPDYRNQMIKWGIVHPDDIDTFNAYCDSMDNGDDVYSYDIRQITDYEHFIWLRYTGRVLKNSDGVPVMSIGITMDVTNEKSEKINLIERASTDSLTGLLNKESTKTAIIECLASSTENSVHGLFIIDIDDFKYINDTYGHLFGDRILKTFSHELKLIFPNEIVGRIGGDEFFIFKKNFHGTGQISETAMLISDIAHNIILNKDLTVTTSIGVSMYPNDGKNYEVLYANSDIALYHTKMNGKNGFTQFRHEFKTDYIPCIAERKKAEKNNITSDTDVNSQIILFAVNTLYNMESVSDAISLIFREIRELYELSRVYMYCRDPDTNKSQIKYLCGLKEDSEEQIKNILDESYDDIRAVSLEKQTCMCEDTSNSDRFKEPKNVSVRSFFHVFSYDHNNFNGLIAYEDCFEQRKWSGVIVNTLSIISKVIYLKTNDNTIDYKVLPVILNTDKTEKTEIKYKTVELYYKKNNDYENNYEISSYLDSQYPDRRENVDGILDIKTFYHMSEKEICQNTTQGHNFVYMRVFNYDMIKEQYGSEILNDSIKIFINHVKTTQDNSILISRINERDFMFLTHADEKLCYDGILCSVNTAAEKIISEVHSLLLKHIMGLKYIEPQTDAKIDIKEAIIHTYETFLFLEYYFPYGTSLNFCSSLYGADRVEQFFSDIKKYEINSYDAIYNDEFKLAVIPEVDVNTGKIAAGEVTFNWIDPSGHCSIYDEYIIALENNKQIIRLEQLMFTKLFRMLKQLDRSRISINKISVKISAYSLNQSDVADTMITLAKRYNIDPRFIEIQISQSVLWKNLRHASGIIIRLKNFGFRICINDISGNLPVYDIISILPIDTVKIHRELFARGFSEDSQRALAERICSYAKNTKCDSIAMNVNSEEIKKCIKEAGYDFAQGTQYYNIMSPEEFWNTILIK